MHALSFAALVALLCASLGDALHAQGDADRGADANAVQTSAKEKLLEALSGSFLAVERHSRKPGETGAGHIISQRRGADCVVRDYWSEAQNKRLYAGHDVLQLHDDGSASHWWFGSRGDHAVATGTWLAGEIVLKVGGDRRYRYDFERAGLAFHFLNEHSKLLGGWAYFMDADYRRRDLELPKDFLPGRSRDDLWKYLVGELREDRAAASDSSGDGRSSAQAEAPKSTALYRGRLLFDEEWLCFEAPGEHGVMRTRAFGNVDLWLWLDDGGFHRFSGKLRNGRLGMTEKDPPRGRKAERRNYVLTRSGFRISGPGSISRSFRRP